MWQNILKTCLVLSVTSVVVTSRTPQVDTNILEDFPDNLNIQPFVRVDHKFYYFGQSKVSWYNAFLVCRTLGGYLASFETPQELDALSNYLIEKYPLDRWWWLSGSDQDSEGNFSWYSTGEPVKYADWSAGQPDNMGGNEDCVHLWHLTNKYQMNDWICKQKAYYICQADKPLTVAVSIF